MITFEKFFSVTDKKRICIDYLSEKISILCYLKNYYVGQTTNKVI